MPLYEYYCSDCRTKFELLVSHQHADDVVASPRTGDEDAGYEEMGASMGSCGCGGGSCGCN